MINSNQPNNPEEKICPFLGLANDQRTAMAYPSTQNQCYHVTPLASPGAAHQRKFCLNQAHVHCELYAAQVHKPLPSTMLGDKKATRSRRFKRSLAWLWILLVFILLSAVLYIWLVLRLGLVQASPLRYATVDPVEQTVAAVQQTVAAPTATPQPTFTATPAPATPTLTPIPPHLLEAPIGADRLFVVHQVSDGESLISLAAAYNTSVDAIRAVNANLGNSLWANTLIILPLAQEDVTGVPPMTIYTAPVDGLTLAALAADQNLPADALAALNGLPADYTFRLGEYVLLPQTVANP